jgi:hypothetical protein
MSQLNEINEQLAILLAKKKEIEKSIKLQSVKDKKAEEGFVPLKDCEDRYLINHKGEVWSIVYDRLLEQQTKEDGYLYYKLTGYTVSKAFLHRLIMKQYVPNPENLPEVDHIDRNKLNNELSNLRWCSRTTNANNKSSNLTEERKEERVVEIREYQRVWAEKDRREKGVPVKEKIKTLDMAAYKREKQAEYRENMTEEEKEAHLKHRREIRPEQTEEEKEDAKERARKQREKIKADPEKAKALKEYKRKKAAEYRDKKALEKH